MSNKFQHKVLIVLKRVNKVLQDITLFVENDCTLEDGETENELINDLINQIYN